MNVMIDGQAASWMTWGKFQPMFPLLSPRNMPCLHSQMAVTKFVGVITVFSLFFSVYAVLAAPIPLILLKLATTVQICQILKHDHLYLPYFKLRILFFSSLILLTARCQSTFIAVFKNPENL